MTRYPVTTSHATSSQTSWPWESMRAIEAVTAARRIPRRRTWLVSAGLVVALVAAFAARVLLGDYTFTPGDAVRIVLGEKLPGADFILLHTKLPRAVLAVLAGSAFGVAGAIFQGALRNPLASPDIVGVAMGASAAATFAIIELGQQGVTIAAWAAGGALAMAAIVRLVGGSGQRLILVGVGATVALQAVVQYLFTRADQYDAHVALRWLTGSVSYATWPQITLVATGLLVLLPLVAALSTSLGVVELGPELATGLGVGSRRTDLVLVLAVLLVALAVAVAGPIAFVAFLSGPIARGLNGGRLTLVVAGLVGALLVVAAEYPADYLFADVNYPVGVITGALGAPCLLWLLATGNRVRSSR
ncbi:MAG: FecCD family ABC transporter permease [Actinomycetales bacterium]